MSQKMRRKIISRTRWRAVLDSRPKSHVKFVDTRPQIKSSPNKQGGVKLWVGLHLGYDDGRNGCHRSYCTERNHLVLGKVTEKLGLKMSWVLFITASSGWHRVRYASLGKMISKQRKTLSLSASETESPLFISMESFRSCPLAEACLKLYFFILTHHFTRAS